MAEIIPMNPNEFNSNAEEKVFKMIKRKFDINWKVIYSYKWNRWTKARETDFVLIHKDYGIIALEVKGGRVSCENGGWQTIDRNNKIIKYTKSPIVQANEESVQLYKEFKKRYKTFYIVVFPDVIKKSFVSNTNYEKYIIFSDELERMENRIEEVIQWEKQCEGYRTNSKISDNVVNEMVKYFNVKCTSLKEPSESHYIRMNNELEILTSQQIRLFESINNNSKASITGKSGSGKTFLLKKKAISDAEKGKRVLILTFTKELRNIIANELNDIEKVRVLTLAKYIQEETGIEDFSEGKEKFYDKTIDYLKWDIVLIDEAQEFGKKIINKFKNEKKEYYVFYDINQNLNERDMGKDFSYLDFEVRLELSQNLRNGKMIEKLLENIMGDEYFKCSKWDYDESVKLIFIKSDLERKNMEIFFKEKLKEFNDSCYLLTTENNSISQYCKSKNCMTVRQSKGIEKACVLFYDEKNLINSSSVLDKTKDTLGKKMLYAGCSRAVKELYIFLKDKGNEENRKIAKRLNLEISKMK